MIVFETPADMAAAVGRDLGVSDWHAIDQATIDAFAAATGDRQWIHVDVARAKAELPGGTTIAHGYLLLSLLPVLAAGIWRIEKRSRSLNYGLNKLRFTSPVPVGARVRLKQKIVAAEATGGGWRIVMENVLEIDGESRPALVAETISLSSA